MSRYKTKAEERADYLGYQRGYHAGVKKSVKHGRWIIQDKGIIVTSYCCSECGRVVRDDTGYDVAIDYPYCHCGAKMDEVEE